MSESETAVGVRDLLATWERGPGPNPRWHNQVRAAIALTEEANSANAREAVIATLMQHRAPVYGACGCGWPIPGYPYSNGSVHWREHIADVILARAFPALTAAAATQPAGDEREAGK